MPMDTMDIRTTKTEWREVILVCRKCSVKLKRKGFGPDQDRSLAKALRRWLKGGKDRKARVAVIETRCFDLCPKGAVVAVNARRPERLLMVRPGMELTEIRKGLGLKKPDSRSEMDPGNGRFAGPDDEDKPKTMNEAL